MRGFLSARLPASATRVLLALAVLLPAPVVTQATAAPVYQVLEVARVRPGGPRDITIRMQFASSDPRGIMALVAVVKSQGRNTLAFAGIVEHASALSPTTYGTGTPGAPELVETPVEGVYETVIGPFASMRYFVVTGHADVKVTVDSPAWRVRPINLGVRRVLDEDTGQGVRTFAGGVESFTAATAPGGKYGSMVWGAIPCGSVGTGSASLDGTTHPISLSCGDNSAMASHHARTTWHLHGDVRGVGDTVTRLFVLDFPR